MSKLGVIADVHAQRSAWANRPIEGDSAFALSQFAEICLDEGVDAALGLGDLKERPVTKSYDDGLWLRTVGRLDDGDVPFLYIMGNHDKADPPCMWEYPNTVHLGGQPWELPGGELLYGIDYQDTDSLPAALDAAPAETTILACHQRWGEFMGSATNPQGLLAAVAGERLRLLLSGDLHETVVKTIAGVMGPFTFVSPGPPTMQSIVEDDDKYVVVVDGTKPRLVKLKARAVIRSPMLMGPAELDDYLQQLPGLLAAAQAKAENDNLPDELHTPILHVRHSYKLDDCVRRVTRLVGAKAHLFWKEQPPDKVETDTKVAVIARGEAVTPVGLLRHVVDPDKEPLAYALVERGLTSRDREEMQRKTKEFCDAFLEGRDVDQGD